MSAEVFPTEILLHIFRSLDGRNLMKCRRVCTRWRDIVHGYYKQDYWQRQCAQEFRATYLRCYVNAKLSWRELFNSLALWDDLGDSALKLRHVHTVQDVRDCRFLKDGILGYRLQKARFSQAVAYCDIHALEHITEINMGNRIQKYDENENLIVYEFQAHTSYCIRAICKLDTEKVADEYIYAPSQWWLQGNSVYYMRRDERSAMQHLSRMSIEWDMRYGVHIYVEVLAAWSGTIDELVEENGRLVILQEVFQAEPRICGMNVTFYRIADGVRKYARYMGVVDIDEFWCFGYAWTKPSVLRWVKKMLPNDPRLTKHDVYSALNYGKFLLVTTNDAPGSIKIFDDPYEDGNMVLDKREPVAVLDLSSVIGYTTSNITLLYVIEVFCGHRIMVLCGGNLVIMDLDHVGEDMYGDKEPDVVQNEDTSESSDSDKSADTLSSSLSQSPMQYPQKPIDVRSEFISVASSIQEVISLSYTPGWVELDHIPEESEPEPEPEELSTSSVASDPSTCKPDLSPSEPPTPKETTKRPPGSPPEAERPPPKASRSSTLPSFTEDPLEGSFPQLRKSFQEDAHEDKDRPKKIERSLSDSSSDICDSLPELELANFHQNLDTGTMPLSDTIKRPWLSTPKLQGPKTYKGPSPILEPANIQQIFESGSLPPFETFKRPWLSSPNLQSLKTYKGPSSSLEPANTQQNLETGTMPPSEIFKRPWLPSPKTQGLKTYRRPSPSSELENSQHNLETGTFKRPWLPSPKTQGLRTYRGPSAKREKPSTSPERIDSGPSCSTPISLPVPSQYQQDKQEASVSRSPPSLRADEGGFSYPYPYPYPFNPWFSLLPFLRGFRTLRPEDEGASTSRGGIGFLPAVDEGASVPDSPTESPQEPPDERKYKKDSRKERYKKSATKETSDK